MKNKSLKQGIEDGFLAPYKVVRIGLDKDLVGYRPEKGKKDKNGYEIPDIEHAERMRQDLINENKDLYSENNKYIMRITGDNAEGKAQLENF
ncbi:MAG: hypothetical protein RSD28_08820 [Lachnospiraceae bacterium]